jgi:hypothetical protein
VSDSLDSLQKKRRPKLCPRSRPIFKVCLREVHVCGMYAPNAYICECAGLLSQLPQNREIMGSTLIGV